VKSEIPNPKSEENPKSRCSKLGAGDSDWDLAFGICFGFRISDCGFQRNRSRAFSALELIVVLAILSLLLAIFVPYLLKVREDNNRMRCFDNLRTLGGALSDYARTNGGDYPRVVCSPAAAAGGYTCYTGADSPNPFAKNSSVAPNDVTASLWLLVRMKLAQPADFICPSSADIADNFADAAGEQTLLAYRSNFREPENLSYSYACPFSAAPDYRFNSDRLDSNFAVLADKNPGIEDGGNVTGPPANAPPLELAVANSANHGRAGQNVLYADGHAEFRASPYCGVANDNIYTAQAPAPLGATASTPPSVIGVIAASVGPARFSDSYLVPTQSDASTEAGPAPAPPPKPAPPKPSPPKPASPKPAPPKPSPPTAKPPVPQPVPAKPQPAPPLPAPPKPTAAPLLPPATQAHLSTAPITAIPKPPAPPAPPALSPAKLAPPATQPVAHPPATAAFVLPAPPKKPAPTTVPTSQPLHR
jgi:prepilin-type N-terminal cleavage/methylation domain-containing protein/prepilin-type processing-associated H-X9-DG protein